MSSLLRAHCSPSLAAYPALTPSSTLYLLLPFCFIWTPAEMSTVAIHTFHHFAMILEANDKGPLCSSEMSGQIWAPTVPRGNILSHQRERGCWLTEASALRTLPPLWPPPLHSIWFMHAHGLSWPVASSKPLSTVPYNKRTWPGSLDPTSKLIGEWWQLEVPQALAFFTAFFSFPTPCLTTQS